MFYVEESCCIYIVIVFSLLKHRVIQNINGVGTYASHSFSRSFSLFQKFFKRLFTNAIVSFFKRFLKWRVIQQAFEALYYTNILVKLYRFTPIAMSFALSKKLLWKAFFLSLERDDDGCWSWLCLQTRADFSNSICYWFGQCLFKFFKMRPKATLKCPYDEVSLKEYEDHEEEEELAPLKLAVSALFKGQLNGIWSG